MTYDPARMVSFDCETHLVQPGLLAPPFVCASVASLDGAGKAQGKLLDRELAREWFVQLLREDWIIVGANIAYDLLVMAVDAARRGEDLMPDIFRAYDEGRVFDVQIAEALHAVAHGHLGKRPDGSPLRDAKGKITTRYSLDNCVRLVLGRDNAKVHDRWRLRYHELEHLPIEEWPEDAKIYPVDDAVNTLEVAVAQVTSHRVDGVTQGNLHDVAAQCRAAWGLHLGAAWGFRVDGAAVDALEARVTATRAKGLQTFIDAGFFKIGQDGRPLVSEKTGAEKRDEALIKKLTAVAYGCSGTCPTCGGSCKVPGETKCKACDGSGCATCNGRGKVAKLKKNGEPASWKGCPSCDSTGLALDSAPVPRTDGGGVSIGRDALFESGDELLMNFAAFSEEDKLRTTYIPFLRKGVDAPLNLRPNTVLETGRASYEEVVQQLPREGGVRECFVARPGKVFVSSDYGGLELATHAQSCLWLLGYSELARALNGGIKVHDAMGARLGGITYEEILARSAAGDKMAKAWRQAAKAANFGFPGGMGAPKLVLQKRKEGETTASDGTVYKGLRLCVLLRGALRCGEVKVTEWKDRPLPPTCRACIECAEELRNAWFEQWPENRDYFALVSQHADRGWVEQHVSRRVRGGVTFTSAANGYFQGLAADGAKLALYRTSRECYVDRDSPLYGSRVILFAHDELILEVPEDRAHEAATRLGEVMVAAMREFVPDVAVTAEPALMRRWYKGAEPVYHGGRLVPWEPDHNAKTCPECQAAKAAA